MESKLKECARLHKHSLNISVWEGQRKMDGLATQHEATVNVWFCQLPRPVLASSIRTYGQAG